MTRYIKFRAWDKHWKRMYQWSDDRDLICEGIPLDMGDEWTDQLEVMQFTGLKDMSGKEIYEGDIVRHYYFNFNGVFKWDHSGFKLFYTDGVKQEIYPIDCGHVEVLGNIYEHPDLIREEKKI